MVTSAGRAIDELFDKPSCGLYCDLILSQDSTMIHASHRMHKDTEHLDNLVGHHLYAQKLF